MPELLTILEARDKDAYRHQRFEAAIQGIELPDPFNNTPSLEDIKARAKSKQTGFAPDDVMNFADDIGLGYETA